MLTKTASRRPGGIRETFFPAGPGSSSASARPTTGAVRSAGLDGSSARSPIRRVLPPSPSGPRPRSAPAPSSRPSRRRAS
eukprot:9378914-Heterocapsa_arctica.AAC.1